MENIETPDEFRRYMVGKSLVSIASSQPEMFFLNKNRPDIALEAIELLRGVNKPLIAARCRKKDLPRSVDVIAQYLKNNAREIWEGPTCEPYLVESSDPFWSRLVKVVDVDLAAEMLQCKACVFWLHVDLLACLTSVLPPGTMLIDISDETLAKWWTLKKEIVITPYLTPSQIITGMLGDPESRVSEVIKFDERPAGKYVTSFVAKLNVDVYKLVEWLFDSEKGYNLYKGFVIAGFLEDPAATSRLLRNGYIKWRLQRAFQRFDPDKTPLVSAITGNKLAVLQHFRIEFRDLSDCIPNDKLSNWVKCVVLNASFRDHCSHVHVALCPDITLQDVYVLMYYNNINTDILFGSHCWEEISSTLGINHADFVKNYKLYVKS